MEASVSVIVPALNESARVARAVKSALAGGAQEVIVVDGGSSDDTSHQAALAGAIVTQSPPGRAVQQNAGAARARGNVLLFLHADNWLSVEAIDQIKQHCRQRGRVAGAFRQSIEAGGLAYRTLEQGNALRVRWLGRPYGDQGIFVDRELFMEIGRFADVPLLEDVLIMREIRRHLRPALLPGPIYVDARRWQQRGICRQTLRNWSVLAAHALGWTPANSRGFIRRIRRAVRANRTSRCGRDAGCGMRDAGCGMRDAGCGMRDTGCGMRDAGCGIRDSHDGELSVFRRR